MTDKPSNAEQMIIIPHDLAQRLCKDYTGCPNWDALEDDRLAAVVELRALLAKPAEQHQGEPVDALLLDDCVEHKHPGYGAGYFGTEVIQLYTNVDAGEVSLQQIMHAYEYAESHPHKYLRGTTNWCAAVAWHLNKNRGVQSGE